MIGLLFLFILVVYITAVVFTVRRLQSKAVKYIAIAIYVLIPTWDILPGYVYFRYLCETEGGNKIYRSVDNVDGFYSEGGMPFSDNDAFIKHGYKFIEGPALTEGYKLYTLGPKGRIASKEISELTSKYGLRNVRSERSWNTIQFTEEIYDIKTNEVYARSTEFRYLGGWIHTESGKLIGMSSGLKMRCPYEAGYEKLEMILSTLKPMN